MYNVDINIILYFDDHLIDNAIRGLKGLYTVWRQGAQYLLRIAFDDFYVHLAKRFVDKN